MTAGTIYAITADTARDVWHDIVGFFEPALRSHLFVDAIDLFHICMAGRAQVFVVLDDGAIQGAAIMEIVTYPSNRVANIMAVGGKAGFLRQYMEVLGDTLIDWSRAQGCDNIWFEGRPGWVRWLRQRYGAIEGPPTVSCYMPLDDRAGERIH